MKHLYLKGITAALAMTFAGNVMAQETEFPEPTLLAPLPGVSVFYMVDVTWDYMPIERGENMTISLTTPSGENYVANAYLESVVEDDQGGNVSGSNPLNYNNALAASFFNQNLNGFKEEGIYTIIIPEGAITLNGVPNPEQIIPYRKGPEIEMAPATWTPTETDNLSKIYVDWGAPISLTRAGSMGMSATMRYNDRMAELLGSAFSFETADGEPATAKSGDILVINIANYVNGYGIYTVTLKEGLVANAEGEINPEQEFVVNYIEDAGVSIINAENGLYNVYGIDGRKVLSTREATSLQTLPAGIYVINGQKVVVK